MKRMIAILLAVLTMAVILAGCNSTTNGTGSYPNGGNGQNGTYGNAGYGQNGDYGTDGYVPSDAYANDGFGAYNNAPAGQNGTGNFGRDMDRAMDEAGNAIDDAGRAVGDAIGGNNTGTGMAGGR